jgi:hypothetical protein
LKIINIRIIYKTMSNIGTDLNSLASNTFNFTNNLLANSTIIFIVAVIIIMYVVLGPTSSNSNSYNDSENGTNGSSVIGSIITIILLLIIFIIVIKLILGFDIIKYFYNFDIYAYLYNLIYGPLPELPKLSKIHEIRNQVFNIPQNTYVYDDAKAMCTAYGARLATYKEVEDSYEGGGEWCNYGWSDGQLALFPTQQKTYDHLQTTKGHENDCGRPGVNGGFIANPNLRFGVNCYGKKPKMTQAEEDLMATQPIYPRTVDELELEDRVKYWKDKLTTVLVSPFNHDTWSKV